MMQALYRHALAAWRGHYGGLEASGELECRDVGPPVYRAHGELQSLAIHGGEPVLSLTTKREVARRPQSA